MKCLDPGHLYEIEGYDGGAPQAVRFMKRVGADYPFNDSAYGGTNCQEVLRVLIDRVRYLDRQQSCRENEEIVEHLRAALLLFETRAAERHGKNLTETAMRDIVAEMACATCGHVCCDTHTDTAERIASAAAEPA